MHSCSHNSREVHLNGRGTPESNHGFSGRPWREAGFSVLETIATASARNDVGSLLLWIWCWISPVGRRPPAPRKRPNSSRISSDTSINRKATIQLSTRGSGLFRAPCVYMAWASRRATQASIAAFSYYIRVSASATDRASCQVGLLNDQRALCEILRHRHPCPGRGHGSPSLQNLYVRTKRRQQ